MERQDSACILQAQNSVKAGLLEALSAEPVTSVRRAVSIVVATIARTDVPAGEWPQLLPWLHHCTQSTSEAHRETALVLLCSLTETIGAVPADLFGRNGRHSCSMSSHSSSSRGPASGLVLLCA